MASPNGAQAWVAQVWREDKTGCQVYTVRNIHPFLAEELVARRAAPSGLILRPHLAYNRPPVRELEFELDCRAINRERVL